MKKILLLVFLMIGVSPVFGAQDFVLPARFASPDGGVIANYMRIDYYEYKPRDEIRPGDEIEMAISFANLSNNFDSYVQMNAFGNWFPNNELASIIKDRRRRELPSIMRTTFYVRAPATPGEYTIRVFWLDADRPIQTYYGGTDLPGGQQTSPDMWTEFNFRVQNLPGNNVPNFLPIDEGIPKQIYQPIGMDYTNKETFVSNKKGERTGYMRFDDYYIYPRNVYAGEDVEVKFKFTNLNTTNANALVNCIVYGDWTPEPLAHLIKAVPRGVLPKTIVKSATFPAPEGSGFYKIRWMVADNPTPPISFNGGFAERDRKKDSPDMWTEIPLQVLPPINMFNVLARNEELQAKAVRDDCAGRLVEPFEGEKKGYMKIIGYDIQEQKIKPEDLVHVSLGLETLKGSEDDRLFMQVFGNWDKKSDITMPWNGWRKGGDSYSIQIINFDFKAPFDPGDYIVRVIISNSEELPENYLGHPSGENNPIKLATELPFRVIGKRQFKRGTLSEDEEDPAELLKWAMSQGIPIIEHMPIRKAAEGIDLTLYATVVLEGKITETNLYYRKQGDTEYTGVTMEPFKDKRHGRQIFRATIPKTVMISPGIQYFIETRDDKDNLSTFPYKFPEKNGIKVDVSVDKSPPKFKIIAPKKSSKDVDPSSSVYVECYEEEGTITTGLDLGTIRMYIDKREVFAVSKPAFTRAGAIIKAKIVFTPQKPLEPGVHNIEIAAKDYAGNEGKLTEWDFYTTFATTAYASGTGGKFGRQSNLRGMVNSTYYDYKTSQQNPSGIGSTLTNNISMYYVQSLKEGWNMDASMSLSAYDYYQQPNLNESNHYARMEEVHVKFDSEKYDFVIGDLSSRFPYTVTSNSSFRGILAAQNPFKWLHAFQVYEPKKKTTSSWDQGKIYRERWGGRILFDVFSNNVVKLGTAYLRVEEEPILFWEGNDHRGSTFGIDGELNFFKDKLKLTGESGWSTDDKDLSDTIGPIKEYGHKFGLTARFFKTDLTANYSKSEPNFGDITNVSISKDYRTFNANLSRPLFKVFNTGLGMSWQRDNVGLAKLYSTASRTYSSSLSFSKPKWPSVNMSYSEAKTITQDNPKTTNENTQNFSVSGNYSLSTINISSSYNITHKKDFSARDSRSDYWSNSNSISVTPRRWLNVKLGYNQSKSTDLTTAIISRSPSYNTGLTFSYIKNLNVGINYTESTSRTSDFRTDNLSRNFSVNSRWIPTWKDKQMNGSFNVTFQQTGYRNRLNQGDDYVQNTFQTNFLLNF